MSLTQCADAELFPDQQDSQDKEADPKSLRETVVLFAAVHPDTLPDVLSGGRIEPWHAPLHESFKSKDAGPGEVGFLSESLEDTFFLMHKSASRALRVGLSDGGARAVDMNDATGEQSSSASEHGLVGTRTVTLKLEVPLRAWYEWHRERAQFLKTPLRHFQFQWPFSFAEAGSVVACFSALPGVVLDAGPS